MKISKSQFVSIIESCLKQMERDREIERALDKVVEDGSNRSLVFTTPLVSRVIDALDDELETISWWIWDGPEAGKNAEEFAIYTGEIGEPGTERVVIHNAGDLYDYLARSK